MLRDNKHIKKQVSAIKRKRSINGDRNGSGGRRDRKHLPDKLAREQITKVKRGHDPRGYLRGKLPERENIKAQVKHETEFRTQSQ